MLSLILTSSSWARKNYPCLALIKEKKLTLEDPENRFFYWEEKTEGAYLTARLEEGGVLHFAIRTQDENGAYLSSTKAHPLFEQMLTHFGDRVNAIKGDWIVETDETSGKFAFALSSNLQQYQKARDQGLSREDAAWTTWTGKEAWQHNFRSIRVVSEHLIGNFAISLQVLFEKDVP